MSSFRMIICFLILPIVLSACRAPETTAPPVNPPTSPTQPTAPTALSITPAPAGNSLTAAFAKTQAAQASRMAMTLNVQQGSNPLFALNLQGQMKGEDTSYTYRFGDEQIEWMLAQGQFFVKGASSIGLPDANKWYSVTPDLADAVRPPFSRDDILNSFASQVAKQPFQSLARESMDGERCQVWRYVPKTAAETGLGNILGIDQPNSSFSMLDQAEIKLWVCDDDALHQLSVEIAAHNANEKASAKLLLHVWDLDSPTIKVDPPANAQPFDLRVPTP